ncbi:hypothetical protein [Streptomyces sp. NPDC048521]|uniref:hypothetical protein n=1 Tax=Streptomyces sp. NPDC048521 TaxID=3365566 RepID=UPI003712920E
MHSTKRGTAAGLLGAVALCLCAPAHAFAALGAAPEPDRYCGTDRASGLAVWAGRTESCAGALRVASAFTRAASGTAHAPGTVRVGGAVWKCQERQGDPNPYQECVNSSDSSRRVTLSS